MIRIPHTFIALCLDWHGGTDCMLYAIASTGGLTRGSIRPWNHDEERPMTDQEWDRSLWASLSSDLRSILRMIGPDNEDYDDLVDFERFASAIEENINV